MEDNNAINQQLNNAVNYEEEYNKLSVDYKKIEDAAKHWFNKAQQLEENWLWNRANFLLEVIKCGKFKSDVVIKAEEELTNWLFPPQQSIKDDKNKED